MQGKKTLRIMLTWKLLLVRRNIFINKWLSNSIQMLWRNCGMHGGRNQAYLWQILVLPPPNVTGALHIGHALTSAIQVSDTMIPLFAGVGCLGTIPCGAWDGPCWNSNPDVTFGVPLVSCGIYTPRLLGVILNMCHFSATLKVVLEKKIMQERKLTRHDVGRENLYLKDLRLVNWYCILRTAISDIDVDYLDIKERTPLKVPGYEKPVEFGVLTSFAYPLEGGLGEIIVATTRVETMLVCDAMLVDRNFGTGAVKITPIHDPNDFEVGQHHNLDLINIFTDDGKINSNGSAEFAGIPRFTAREAVTAALQRKGIYRGAENNEMRLGICSRINDVVEPLIKPQWYVNCSSMAKQALDAVFDEVNRKMEIIPKQYAAEWKRYFLDILMWDCFRKPGLRLLTRRIVVVFGYGKAAMVGGTEFRHSMPYVTLKDDELKELAVEGFQKRLEEGNLDPTELEVAKDEQRKDFPNGIPECGADALRFALVSYTAQLWSAVRFAIVPDVMPFSCQWILTVLNKTISKTISSLDSYEFSDAVSAVYSWWQFQLCDVFIEAVKPYYASDDSKFASARGFA
ncbi:Valine--tRNA ligase [Actinidia chinensis var. chinensis]|uniref:valine--tRNA ligase n=1 Tax=Actinidia chinensis var. chinensis TaxID=1590841 RepID=A0A2R6PM29_ACTCC|nr:Valine--tRNA ligase [Actinidia chinensis var. chinensis]